VFIPKANSKDIEDIPEEVRNKLKIITIQNVRDIFAEAFISSDTFWFLNYHGGNNLVYEL
ncbi:MAG: S16 family serine protease, partial [Sweet potato little leaf phytoplasma]|nr:S16 family serine protease [Sweet potato little leaf phytoplasma]